MRETAFQQPINNGLSSYKLHAGWLMQGRRRNHLTMVADLGIQGIPWN